MKLKKIASLALAGVMAVSMLAGCKGNNSGSTGDQGNTVVETTGIAKELNDAQTPGNTVKVSFTSDSSFDADLAEAAKRAGQGATSNLVMTHLIAVSGIVTDKDYTFDETVVTDDTKGLAAKVMKDNSDCKSATDRTFLVVTKSAYLTKDAAMADFANVADSIIAKLPAKTSDTVGAGESYYTFGYTGKASMVEVANNDGTTSYYFAVVLTQNHTKVSK